MPVRPLFAVVIALALVASLAGCRSDPNKNNLETPGYLDPYGPLDGETTLPNWGSGEPGRLVTDVSFADVLFDFDSARIRQSERHKLEALSVYLRRKPATRVVMDGHCDERGSRGYNMALGERRAHAARTYLIGLGIDGSRIMTRSYGEERPSDLGHNEQAWSRNRRAEFAIYR